MTDGSKAKVRRIWTDDQLRSAVAAQRSWRGVIRQLGFNPASSSMSRTLQKRAARLGLDTSHFTGNRRWDDVQLIDAIKKASSWKEVGDYLGVVLDPPCGQRIHLRGHAARLGLDTSHLSKPTRPVTKTPAISELGYRPEQLRRAAPSIAMAWFALRGCTSSLPSEPEVYDLLVGSPFGIQRASFWAGAFAFTSAPTRITSWATRRAWSPRGRHEDPPAAAGRPGVGGVGGDGCVWVGG